jgi:hypothetical protein
MGYGNVLDINGVGMDYGVLKNGVAATASTATTSTSNNRHPPFFISDLSIAPTATITTHLPSPTFQSPLAITANSLYGRSTVSPYNIVYRNLAIKSLLAAQSSPKWIKGMLSTVQYGMRSRAAAAEAVPRDRTMGNDDDQMIDEDL